MHNIRQEDAGRYICKLYYHDGRAVDEYVQVNVNRKYNPRPGGMRRRPRPRPNNLIRRGQ